MCGIIGVVGPSEGLRRRRVSEALTTIGHRGPDDYGVMELGEAVLGHRRLSIVDLSEAGQQPMSTQDGRLTIVFNGEIYNYRELRRDLGNIHLVSGTDTEVLLACYDRWGPACLDRLIGMFAFAIWDAQRQELFAARDRFGVKPLYVAEMRGGGVAFASEIKALHALGLAQDPDPVAWATYLGLGVHDHGPRTFWSGVSQLEPGHALRWSGGQTLTWEWYSLEDSVADNDDRRPPADVEEQYAHLLRESVALRFRSDVPVGVNLSGGLDSSALLATVQAVQGADSETAAFTFICGDPNYDELPWVREMLATTRHPLVVCELKAYEVPALAESLCSYQEGPYGGLPTLAYARLFEEAKARDVTVLLDGQGMDEQWAGYDYYRSAVEGVAPLVQGARAPAVRPNSLDAEFAGLAEVPEFPRPYRDPVRNLQLRDIRYTKLQRALRFNDRVSMRASCELREPFLDHRLVELALAQPVDRKIDGSTGKVTLRRILQDRLPTAVVEAPKRPLQTPQREWLRGPLKNWVRECIDDGLREFDAWLRPKEVVGELTQFLGGEGDNSYHIWQWISLGLLSRQMKG